MPRAERPPGPRRVFAWILCFLALASVTAIGAILVVLASLNEITGSTRNLLIAAVSFDMLALLVFAAVAGIFMKQLHGRAHLPDKRGLRLVVMFGTISTLALILTFASLAEARSVSNGTTIVTAHQDEAEVLSAAAISLNCLFMVALIGFFLVTMGHRAPRPENASVHGGESSFSSELKESPRSTESRDVFTPDGNGPRSPVTSGFSATPPRRASIRNSVSNFIQPIIQPMTSKSRLIRQGSFITTISHHSRDDSWGNRAEDAFDNWEITPNDRPRTPMTPSAAYSTTHLDTIVGSNPSSPAKGLEGPFRIAEFPCPSTSTVDLTTYKSDHSAMPMPYAFARKNSLPPHGAVGAVGRRLTPPGSRSAAAAAAAHFRQPSGEHVRRPSTSRGMSFERRPSAGSADEAHIHPLFRTESPLPPPNASPGTIVMASPWGGQVVPAPEGAYFTRSRSASASRPDSPLTLSRERSGHGGSGGGGGGGTTMVRAGSAQGYVRSESAQGRMRSASGAAMRPPLRTVRSEDRAWGIKRESVEVNASMPPRVFVGVAL